MNLNLSKGITKKSKLRHKFRGRQVELTRTEKETESKETFVYYY